MFDLTDIPRKSDGNSKRQVISPRPVGSDESDEGVGEFVLVPVAKSWPSPRV